MALQDLEKLGASIVVLPGGDFDVNLGGREIREIVKEPQIETIPPPVNMVRVTSLRDQVEITVGQGRFQVSDHSNDMPGTDRFTTIVSEFAELLKETGGVTYKAYGWNYDVAFSASFDELPAPAIARRFIDTEAIKSKTGLDVVGGGVRFFYVKGESRCFLYLDPRNDRLDATGFFAHVNVHVPVDKALPARETLQESFCQEYEEFIQAIEAMLS